MLPPHPPHGPGIVLAILPVMLPPSPPPVPGVVPTPEPTARRQPILPPMLPLTLPPRPPLHPLTHPPQSRPPAFIEPDDDYDIDIRDDNPSKRPTTPPLRLYALSGQASISRHALYHVINLAFNTAPTYTIHRALHESTDRFRHVIDIEEVCNGVVHPVTKETITKYPKLMNDSLLKNVWVPAMSKELHRLAQGKDGVTNGTNTIFFLSHNNIRCIPKDRVVTYARIVIDHCPQKDDPNRVRRITVGGNLIEYPYELTTRTANMVSTKIMWNSVISTPGAKFGGADIKNMYLETPLDRYEYMKMPMRLLPDNIIEHYGLRNKALHGYVYMEIRRVMYGLPQAGILANKLLRKRLALHGYFEQPHTPGLWKHVSRPIWFNL
jgi:hypothetical protein